jgi:hypothetical protein
MIKRKEEKMSKLKNVTITKVDLVPEGMNQGANIFLYKNKGGKINMEELIKQLLEDEATKEVGEKLQKELKTSHEEWIKENVEEQNIAHCGRCHILYDKFWNVSEEEMRYCAPCYFLKQKEAENESQRQTPVAR